MRYLQALKQWLRQVIFLFTVGGSCFEFLVNLVINHNQWSRIKKRNVFLFVKVWPEHWDQYLYTEPKKDLVLITGTLPHWKSCQTMQKASQGSYKIFFTWDLQVEVGWASHLSGMIQEHHASVLERGWTWSPGGQVPSIPMILGVCASAEHCACMKRSWHFYLLNEQWFIWVLVGKPEEATKKYCSSWSIFQPVLI